MTIAYRVGIPDKVDQNSPAGTVRRTINRLVDAVQELQIRYENRCHDPSQPEPPARPSRDTEWTPDAEQGEDQEVADAADLEAARQMLVISMASKFAEAAIAAHRMRPDISISISVSATWCVELAREIIKQEALQREES